MKRKPIYPALNRGDSDPELHCPVCWKKRRHYQRIQGKLIIYKCQVCKHEQSYIYTPRPAEVEA